MARISDRLGAAATTATAWTGAARAWAVASAGATMAGVALVTAPAVAAQSLSGPMMALLLLVPLALAEVAAPLAEAGALSARTDAAAARLARLSRTAPAVRDTVGRPGSGRHDVELDDARGRWDDRAPATTACSLRLAPGDRVALVGPSGSGKSTVAALLIRFLDPSSGTVRHGGQDLRDLTLDDVRRSTGLVDDDPHVFATTLAENVRLASPGATDDMLLESLRHAGLGELGGRLSPTDSTPGWATATRGCRAVSAPGWASPAPCWPTSPCWSSTSPPATSTTPPPPPWPRSC